VVGVYTVHLLYFDLTYPCPSLSEAEREGRLSEIEYFSAYFSPFPAREGG
jgi:hypothetical protein